MIKIDTQPARIAVTGHANTGPPGHDICCAAVSTLLQTLEASIRQLTGDRIQSHMEPGDAVIQWDRDLSESAKLLIDSFFIGICGVADAYPDNVKLI